MMDRIIIAGKGCVVYQQGVLVKVLSSEQPWQGIHQETGVMC